MVEVQIGGSRKLVGGDIGEGHEGDMRAANLEFARFVHKGGRPEIGDGRCFDIAADGPEVVGTVAGWIAPYNCRMCGVLRTGANKLGSCHCGAR